MAGFYSKDVPGKKTGGCLVAFPQGRRPWGSAGGWTLCVCVGGDAAGEEGVASTHLVQGPSLLAPGFWRALWGSGGPGTALCRHCWPWRALCRARLSQARAQRPGAGSDWSCPEASASSFLPWGWHLLASSVCPQAAGCPSHPGGRHRGPGGPCPGHVPPRCSQDTLTTRPASSPTTPRAPPCDASLSF